MDPLLCPVLLVRRSCTPFQLRASPARNPGGKLRVFDYKRGNRLEQEQRQQEEDENE
jgi:hypothetical protein